jgi:hypothetical protein
LSTNLSFGAPEVLAAICAVRSAILALAPLPRDGAPARLPLHRPARVAARWRYGATLACRRRLGEGDARAGPARRPRGGAGLSIVADALAIARATGACYWDAELARLKGTLLLGAAEAPGPCRGKGRRASAPAESDAEACFLEALAIARRQGAKALELRAATSLARLRQAQGRTREAHEPLAGVYGSFGEGFETADVAQARALLAQLGVAPPKG